MGRRLNYGLVLEICWLEAGDRSGRHGSKNSVSWLLVFFFDVVRVTSRAVTFGMAYGRNKILLW